MGKTHSKHVSSSTHLHERGQILQVSYARRPRTRLTERRCQFGAQIARAAQLDKCLRGVSDVQARRYCCSCGCRCIRLLAKRGSRTESNAELARGARKFLQHVDVKSGEGGGALADQARITAVQRTGRSKQ